MLYVAVLTLVCILFSSIIYALSSNEIQATSRRQVMGFRGALGRFIIDDKASEELRKNEADQALARLRSKLLLVNIGVVGIGALLSYYFAKKTLEPVEASARAQERFTSDASHELRTPLASMRTELEVALRMSKLSAAEVKELLASNLEEVMTLQTMTDNLLSLARNQELGDTRVVSLRSIVERVVKKNKKAIKAATQHIETKLGADKIRTNPDALAQVLDILIKNAINHAGPQTQITVSSQTSENELVIHVADNGIGIAPSKTDRIFERFYKADSSRTNSRNMGHGLGLSIAKQLVEGLGGQIQYAPLDVVKSKGAIFSIVLPKE